MRHVIKLGWKMRSMLIGAARSIDLSASVPVYFHPHHPLEPSARDALAGDLSRLGQDLKRVIDREHRPVAQG